MGGTETEKDQIAGPFFISSSPCGISRAFDGVSLLHGAFRLHSLFLESGSHHSQPGKVRVRHAYVTRTTERVRSRSQAYCSASITSLCDISQAIWYRMYTLGANIDRSTRSDLVQASPSPPYSATVRSLRYVHITWSDGSVASMAKNNRKRMVRFDSRIFSFQCVLSPSSLIFERYSLMSRHDPRRMTPETIQSTKTAQRSPIKYPKLVMSIPSIRFLS